MKYVIRIVMFFSMVLLNVKANEQELISKIKQLDHLASLALDQNNIEEFKKYYWKNSNLILLDEGRSFFGINEWITTILSYWEKKPKRKFETFDSRYVVSGDVVIVYHNYVNTSYDKDKKKHQTSGMYTGIWAQRDGNWVIITATYYKLANK